MMTSVAASRANGYGLRSATSGKTGAAMAKTRLGIIGLGMAAAPHAKSLKDLRDRLEVAAAFSPTAERRQAFADAYGFPVCHDVEAIFGDPSIDAMMLLTPPNTHLDLVGRASSAGKHILLEKP